MTRKDIDDIISTICPNDEDFEKPIISPAYLKNELETLALEQQPCDDCISREAIMQTLYDHGCESEIQDAMSKLPPRHTTAKDRALDRC